MGIFNDNSQNDHYGHIKVAERGPPGPAGKDGTGFELTDKGNYDIDGKRLTDVADSIGDNDAVNLKVLKEHTQVSQNNYHLQPSFKIFKDFGDKSQLTVGSPPNTSPDHFFQNHKAHNDAYIIEKEGYDTGFGGEAWSSIKIKGNQLESGSYTSIFEIFVIGDAGGFLVDDTIIYHIYGDGHYTINTFDSDKIDSQYTKSIIQFTTDGGAGVDDGKFLFYSRVIKGKQSTSFNHNIFNVSDVDDNHEILYFENLNMNSNLINGLGDPVDDGDAANKKFVDTEIAKVNIDTTPLLPRNGSRNMFGDLDMDENHILSVENLVDYKDVDPYKYRVKDLKSVVNKEYLNEKFLKKVDKDGREYYDLKQIVIKNSTPHDDGSYDNDTLVSKAFVDAEISKLPKPDTNVLKLDGSKKMTGDLNMNNNEIKNLKYPKPSDASYAASVDFVNNTIAGNNTVISNIIDLRLQESEERSIQSVQQENIFKKVMTDNLFKEDDDRIEFLSTINYNLLHRINHLTYLFRIKKDLSESYNGRLSIDLRYLPSGTYTMVFEMKFFPQIDHDKVSVNAESSSLNQVSTKTRVIKFDYGYYSRSIINFQKLFTNPGIDDLDIDLHLSLKDSVSPKPDKTPINVIVYGVRGTHSDIPIQTWDKLYDINNGTLEFEIPINMNGKAITNLKDPVNDQDAVTKKYVKSVSDSHISSSNKTNAFQYVMNNPSHLIEEDDIEFGNLITFQSSPHSINKKAVDTKLIFDAGHGYYSSRASINLYVLPNGSYTMAFELIWSSDDVDHDTVSLNGISAVETIHDLSNKTFNNYSRLIMQFSKSTDTAPNHLYVDIIIKMKSGKLYPPKLQTYMVCYGVIGLQTDVPSTVYDALWGVDNGVVTFNESIDMGNKKITGLKSSSDLTGAVTYQQLIDHNKNRYELIFEYWFDLLNPNMFNFHFFNPHSDVVSINDKFIFHNDMDLSAFDINNGFQTKFCRIHLDDYFNQNDNFTFFIAFKHDISNTEINKNIGFWDGLTGTWYPPYVKITADKLYLYKTTSTFVSKDIPANYKNQNLMIWFTKNGNEYSVVLCDRAVTIIETISSVTSFNSNRFGINLKYYVKRIGLSKNPRNYTSLDFSKIIFLEKSKGTYFN